MQNKNFAQCDYTTFLGLGTSITTPISGAATYTGMNCTINANIQVLSGGTLTIESNSHVKVLTGGYTIEVQDGGTLIIQDSEIFADAQMWQGIKLQPGATMSINNSKIFHAYRAIDCEGYDGYVTTLTVLNNCCFVNNEIGILITASDPDLIVHAIEDFEIYAPNLISPKSGQIGDYGIFINGSSNILPYTYFFIGNTLNLTTGAASTSYMHDVSIGIRTYQANIKVQNCRIENTLNTISGNLPTGDPINESTYTTGNIGILSTSIYPTPNYERNLIVGLSITATGVYNNEISNSVANGFRGIVAESQMNTFIYSNYVHSAASGSTYFMKEGIKLAFPQSDHSIENNLIENFYDRGIRMNNITTGNTNIINNEITRNTPPSSTELDMIGIAINESTLTTAHDIFIDHNEISNVLKGIWVRNDGSALISNNIIDYRRTTTGTEGDGIKAENCSDIYIVGNSITGNYSGGSGGNNWIGIYSQSNPDIYMDANYISKSSTGILIQENNMAGNATCNELHDCRFGFGFKNVQVDGFDDEFGPVQRFTGVPSDNSWYPEDGNRERHLDMITDLSQLDWYYRNLDIDGITFLPNYDMPDALIFPIPICGNCLNNAILTFSDELGICASPFKLSADSIELMLEEIQQDNIKWIASENIYFTENNYIRKWKLWRDANLDEAIIESLPDAYKTLYSDVESSNISKFYDMQREIEIGNLGEAKNILVEINTENVIEENLFSVYQIYIDAITENGEPVFEKDQREKLLTIASLTSDKNGFGVYMAQAMLDTMIYFNLDVEEEDKFLRQGNENEISIYPNPSDGILYFENGKNEIVEIKIFSITGEQVYQIERFNLSSALNLSVLQNGIYIIEIEANEVEKIIFKILLDKL